MSITFRKTGFMMIRSVRRNQSLEQFLEIFHTTGFVFNCGDGTGATGMKHTEAPIVDSRGFQLFFDLIRHVNDIRVPFSFEINLLVINGHSSQMMKRLERQVRLEEYVIFRRSSTDEVTGSTSVVSVFSTVHSTRFELKYF